MKPMKDAIFACFAVTTLVCFGCGTSNSTQVSFKISNTGEEVVELQATFPDRVAEIRLGENGIRTFPDCTAVGIGYSVIRVNDTRIEVAHKGKEVVTLNYVDSLGNDKTMMLGNGGTGFFTTRGQLQSEPRKYALWATEDRLPCRLNAS